MVFEVDERSSHLSPVAEFQSAFAEAAASDYADRVGGAAIDLNESHGALAVFALGIIYAEFLQTQHSHADAKDLSCAKMAVGDFSFVEEFVKGFHDASIGR